MASQKRAKDDSNLSGYQARTKTIALCRRPEVFGNGNGFVFANYVFRMQMALSPRDALRHSQV
jgi:hypothetical protein